MFSGATFGGLMSGATKSAGGFFGRASKSFNLWSMKHPALGFGAMAGAGAFGLTALGGIAGAISPFGTTGGGAGGIWSGAIKGGIAGAGLGLAGNMGVNWLGRQFGGAGKLTAGAGGAMRNLGLYGAIAGAALGSVLTSNRPPNRIRGLHR